MMNENKGITLIALVITIIVLLILAGVSIAMLTGESGVITQAQKAKISTELSGYKEQLELYKTAKLAENQEFLEATLTAGKSGLMYNTQPQGETGTIKTIINNISDEYLEKLEVQKGKLLINTKDKDEVKMAQSLGIEVNPYDITEEGELLSSNGNLLLVDENGTLTIPASITKIGEGAFANCSGLKTIIIPGSVKEIGNNAFAYNATLETVIMQEGVEKVGISAFQECKALKKVTMPNSLNFIGDMAFYYCNVLTEISIPNKIKIIPSNCFAGCAKLEKVFLEENLTTIANSAFSNTNLKEISIPNTVKEIAINAFDYCVNLNKIELNNNPYYIYENGFLMSKDRTSIIFITSNYLKSIKTLKIPEGIKNFSSGISLFENITRIEIPKSLTSISNATIFPTTIEQVIIDAENPEYISSNGLWYTKNSKELIMCYSKEREINVKENIEVIRTGAFKQATNVVSVTFGDSVTHIKGQPFAGLKSLKTVNIGERVQEISPLMLLFFDDVQVTISNNNLNYTLENGVLYSKDKKILKGCFNVFDGNFVVDENVEVIDENAFNNQKIKKVIINKNVKEIKKLAFTQCHLLEEIEIPSSVISIGGNSFERCERLNSIKIDKRENSILGAPWGAPKGMKVVSWKQ